MADPLLPFIAFLFVLALSLSFSHTFPNFLSIFVSSLIPFTVSSSPNLFTHYLYHSIHLPCCQQRVRVLPIVKEKRLPPMIRPLRLWVESLPITNRTIPKRKKGVAIGVVNVFLSSTHGMIPLPSGVRWLFASFTSPCVAFPLSPWFQSFLGSLSFLCSRTQHPPRNRITHAHSIWV